MFSEGDNAQSYNLSFWGSYETDLATEGYDVQAWPYW